jgi:hypothetical protein
VQELQLHESNNERESSYPIPSMDSTILNHEGEVSKLEKETPSPTQPKTLQQEFSLINMNIPNIEVGRFYKY